MKKLVASAAALLISCSFMGIVSFADEELSANVNVTIADKDGNLAVVQENIKVTDIDNDGKLTVNDALYITHEEKFEGGAAAGYASSVGTYGLAVDKLWGTENGGSYGYYVNNIASMGLADEVAEGDYINAFVYTDLSSWSDKYCWFDINNSENNIGDEITLTLNSVSYDYTSNSNVTNPVEGAVISINGNTSDYVTDANGKVTLKIENSGKNIISAASENMRLVPPVCVINVAENAAETEITTTTSAAEETEETTETSITTESETTSASTTTASSSTTTTAKTTTAKTTSTSPATGDKGIGVMISLLAASAASIIVTKHKNEK